MLKQISALSAMTFMFAVLATGALAANTNYVWTFSPNATYYNGTTANLLLINTTTSPGFMWINYSGYSSNVSLISPYNGTFTLTNGRNNFTVYVNSSTGTMNSSTPFTMNVDQLAPVPVVTSSTGIVNYASSVYLSGTCTDTGIAGVQTVWTDSAYFTAMNGTTPAAWTLVNTSSIPDGFLQFHVNCNDSYNNLGASTYFFTFSNTPAGEPHANSQSGACAFIYQMEGALGIFGSWFGLIILIAIMSLMIGLLVGVYYLYNQSNSKTSE